MGHVDPVARRAYQRIYYKTKKWRKRRNEASARYQARQLKKYHALCVQRFELDDYICVHCKKKFEKSDAFGVGCKLTVDHIPPREPGNQYGTKRYNDGTTTIDSIRTSCRSCNSRRQRKPVCKQCYSQKLPWRHSSGALCCTDCGKLNTFPADTPVREEKDEPDFLNSETDDA